MKACLLSNRTILANKCAPKVLLFFTLDPLMLPVLANKVPPIVNLQKSLQE
jgi:hypothetical protein